MSHRAFRCVCAFAGLLETGGVQAPEAEQNVAVQVAEQLLERILPGAGDHFTFSITDACAGVEAPCYHLTDANDKVAISATGTSELTAGLGYYLREYCNMTIGWPRGGGSNVFTPLKWPKINNSISKRRNVPWSYMMNVCTHSYSLVWYDWSRWERFIDWMALSGINNVLAMTGQEEVQYKVFKSFGLNDTEIRGWFNGPALLTWSRGQNEYGAGIAGPLPRSWMKSQWTLQRQILKRYRELGIIGQLPAFQGNVPVGLKYIKKDANVTVQGATGWLDALDPLYGEVADVWMKTLIEDFGTDHWYQLDGYFNGGTAPWLSKTEQTVASPAAPEGAIDPQWYARGVSAFEGLNRTDPEAIWSFQGFAVEFWDDSAQHASWLRGFVSAVPPGRFSIVDMDYNYGEWKKWDNAAFFGANFIWSALHNFGGTDGIKGNLSRVREMPFAALEQGKHIWGTGFTAEGIDQNPAYYDFLIEQPWRSERVPSIAAELSDRAHRRYGLIEFVPEVQTAWNMLADSMYAQDVSVQDGTGVAHLPGKLSADWSADWVKPSPDLCKTFNAWSQLLRAAPAVPVVHEPFRYDLVNLGRDVLARLSTPMSQRFNDAMFPKTGKPDLQNVTTQGEIYIVLLRDLDKLVGTDSAFLVGPWLAWSREFSNGATDCAAPGYPVVRNCEQFYEWNARVQITSWNPTPQDASKVPGGPIDYAAKHWNGLIGDYYAERAARLLTGAQAAAKAGKPMSGVEADQIKATIAYEWTTAFNVTYPEAPVGDAVTISQDMMKKYATYFKSCAEDSLSMFV